MCSKVECSPSLPDQCRSDPKQDELSLQLPLALCGLDASLGEGGGSLLQFTVSGITATAAAYMGLFFLVFLGSEATLCKDLNTPDHDQPSLEHLPHRD